MPSPLTEFEQLTQEFDESITPMLVTIGETEYQTAGTLAEHFSLGLEDGGKAEQRLAHFTIPKKKLPDELPLGTMVIIDGQRLQISKVWGRDEYDPNWSFRAVRFMER